MIAKVAISRLTIPKYATDEVTCHRGRFVDRHTEKPMAAVRMSQVKDSVHTRPSSSIALPIQPLKVRNTSLLRFDSNGCPLSEERRDSLAGNTE